MFLNVFMQHRVVLILAIIMPIVVWCDDWHYTSENNIISNTRASRNIEKQDNNKRQNRWIYKDWDNYYHSPILEDETMNDETREAIIELQRQFRESINR